MKKKVLALVLALVMTLTLLPVTAMAEEPTQQIFWGFEGITSVSQMESGKNYIFFSEPYAADAVVPGLPAGSAILGYAGTDYTTADFPAHLTYQSSIDSRYNYWISAYPTAEDWDNSSQTPSSANLKALYGETLAWEAVLQKHARRTVMQSDINSFGTWCAQTHRDGFVTVIQRDPGFDSCKLGTIAYFDYNGTKYTNSGSFPDTYDGEAWYYGCNNGGVSYVGPFFAYTYNEGAFAADDITAYFKEDPASDYAGEVTVNDIIVKVEVGGETFTLGENFVTIDPQNNTIALPDDRQITIHVGNLEIDLEVSAAPTEEPVTPPQPPVYYPPVDPTPVIPSVDVDIHDDTLSDAAKAVGSAVKSGAADITPVAGYTKESIAQMQKDDALKLVVEKKDSYDPAEKRLIDTAAQEKGKAALVQFLEIDVTLRTMNDVIVAEVDDTVVPLTITVDLNAEMQKAAKEGKTIYVARAHDGKVTFIEGTLNAEKTQFTFDSSKFSTYALVASDSKVVTSPKTADAGIFMAVSMSILSVAGSAVLLKKKED